MAKQKSIVKLKGSLGNISFYKSQDGYLAREKGGVDAAKIKNSSAFERIRENNTEFGEAAKSVDLMLKAFREILFDINTREYRAKLMKRILEVLRMDTINIRGQRKVLNENIELLQGFEFGKHNSFNKLFNVPYSIELYEFEENLWYLDYYSNSAFVPSSVISAPTGTTHYRIMSAGGQIDFENDIHTIRTKPDLEISFNSDFASLGEAYRIDYEAAANLPVFLVLRPVFYQKVNNRLYELKIDSYNTASILFVKKSVDYERNVW